eukprot:CAMPEP_0167799414 /NCGR_PEP_ID=MMETSP0111_2-20121227/17005_1 /TAXON_ID=91324 /ORGANISM="Lotharella globosa, Strain CCCM811" /LENGTH=36 /DNA_ID= /DNA_START= /DNA_END= /DNA_ORIENTATION=
MIHVEASLIVTARTERAAYPLVSAGVSGLSEANQLG